MVKYKHSILNGPRSIRLLHILAEPTNELISARLEEISLEESVEYFALSYVWGNDDPIFSIHIGRKSIMIRKNFFWAIHRVWKLGVRKIWVDAVCINQSDTDEVAQQVMKMRQIYESAKTVIVHLGETLDTPKLDAIFPLVYKLGIKHISQPLEDFPMDWYDLQKQFGLPHFTHNAWEPLVQLASHPWFKRAWTFQEILVAKNCMFVSGDWHALSYEILPVFQALYALKLSNYIDQIPKMGLSGIDVAGRRCISVFRRQKATIYNQRWTITWKRSPLIQLLRESHYMKSTDPRDYIYALLGISYEADEKDLKPNYQEQPDQTFSRVARFLVKRGFGPQLLENATVGELEPAMPSWIPRWDRTRVQVISPSIDLNYIRDSTFTDTYFDASRKTKEAFELDGTEAVLIAQGVIFDSIESIGSANLLITSVGDLPEGVINSSGAIKLTLRYIEEIYRMLLKSRHQNLDHDALLDAVCAIALCERHHRQDTLESIWKGFRMMVLVAHNYVNKSEMYLELFVLSCMVLASSRSLDDTIENRELAFEFHGYIGQVHPNAKVDDKIAILRGCEVPYVLREVGDGLYRLIGNCYFYGIMFGEAWPNSDTDVHEIRIV